MYKEFPTGGKNQTRRASNPEYRIQNAVFNQLETGQLIAEKLLITDNDPQKELLGTICALAGKRKAGQYAEPSQIEEISSFISENMQHMSIDCLDRLEQIATASGLFTLAYALRKKNEEFVLHCAQTKGFLTKQNAARLFWAHINRGDDNAAKNMLRRAGILQRPALTPYIKGLLSAFRLAPDKPAYGAFAEYIKGKKIAVAGPSSSGIDHSEEIMSDFDIIIRMNYRGAGSLPESQRTLTPKISYYNGVMSKKITTPGENTAFLKDLDYTVIKKCSKADFRRISGCTNPREAKKISGLFLRGAPNVLQVIFQDLLHFEPSRIKAFYVNLNLTDTLHDKDYLSALNRTDLKPRDQWRSLAKHNFILQYDYTLQLYKRGLIQADTRLTEVLQLGTEEYVRQLEQIENRKTETGKKE